MTDEGLPSVDWDRYADVLRVIRESQVVVANELLSILHVPSEIEALIPVDLEEPAQLGLGTLFTSS